MKKSLSTSTTIKPSNLGDITKPIDDFKSSSLESPPEINDFYPSIDYEACSRGIGELSPNFTCKEARFYSRDVTLVKNAQKLAYELEKVRELSGPIRVTSWCRSVQRNRQVGGVKNSTHINCSGGDFKTLNTVGFRRLLQSKANVSLGYYRGHTHVDTRIGIFFYGTYALGL